MSPVQARVSEAVDPVERVDLVVLAGGRGERLGGVDKAALRIGGRSMLGRLLEDVADLVRHVVVVTPHALPTDLPEILDRTVVCEDPPGGGPVAGLAAGLAALRGGDHPASDPADRWVAVVAVDQPGAAPALRTLVAALPPSGAGDGEAPAGGPEQVDALSHVDTGGRRQWLLALYRRDVLEAAVESLPGVRHRSVRSVVSGLRWGAVRTGAEHLGDVDTIDDLRAWGGRLP